MPNIALWGLLLDRMVPCMCLTHRREKSGRSSMPVNRLFIKLKYFKMKKMKKHLSLVWTIFIILLVAAIFTFSCKNAGNSDNNNSSYQGNSGTATTASDTVEIDFMVRGEVVYKKECLVCHQSDGSGVPMMFPPITDSEFINGEHEQLILLVLNGMKGPIEINGEQYNSIMPPMKYHLDDQEIADLLSYLRNSFGNSADTITAAEVAKMRE